MKLPSFQFLLTNASKTLKRFPLTLISAAIAVAIGIFLVENESEVKNIFPYVNIMLSSSLGIPLFFSAVILSEMRKLNAKAHWLLMAVIVVLIAVIYFTLPNAESTHNTALPYIKYAIYNITAHLLVSFIPFVFSKQINGFWQHNKVLFIRIFKSILFSGVLFVGLALALTSMHLLFEINIHEKLYFDMYIFIAGIFNTWFFLSGIPEDFNELESIAEYPKGLKIFAQYILLTLLTLYLVILYFYCAKILLSWDWPKGIVSYLIICVSVLGVLTFLLLYPYGSQRENEWIKKASRLFYFLLVPMLILLFIAILMRIGDYGITIKRYVVLFLGIWLFVVCVYTIAGKTNIKFIPLSLALMLLLISFGPWGMFSVSEHYQVKRLQAILEKAAILKNGKIKQETFFKPDSKILEFKNERLLSDSLHNEVKSILDYMDDFHGFSAIRAWYQQDLDAIVNANMKKENSRYYNEAELYMNAMGMVYEEREIENKSAIILFSTERDNNSLQNVTGYDYYLGFNDYNYNEENHEITRFEIDSILYIINYHTKSDKKEMITIDFDNQHISVPFDSMVNSIYNYHKGGKSGMNPERMTIGSTIGKVQLEMRFNSIELNIKKGMISPQKLTGALYIRKRSDK